MLHTRERENMNKKFWLGNIEGSGQRESSTKTEENIRTGPSKYVCV
jgi:hypothetical protein